MTGRSLLGAARGEDVPEAGGLVVGFSGGADSVALAHWLAGRVERERILLAHVNHLIRGEEAERDQAFAESFARREGLAIRVLRADVRALAREGGLGLEECGRQVRYEFFRELAPEEEDRILTAHNAGDNAETILLNLCRGAGGDGLRGVPYRRGKILRPLLGVDREEIEAYCREEGLDFVTDSSNLSDDYARNRVRHAVIPLLKELNPRFIQAAGQAAELLSQDRDFLAGQAAELLTSARGPWGGLEAAPLLAAHKSLRSRALGAYLKEVGCGRLERKHLELAGEVLSQGGGADLPGRVGIWCGQGLFWAGRRPPEEDYQRPARLGETLLPGGYRLILREKILPETENREKIQNLLFKNALDCAILSQREVYRAASPSERIMNGELILRNRRPGDRFAPAGRGLSKPVKQIFQELRAPAPLRGQLPLLAWGGEIAWCPGMGTAEGFQVREETRRIWTVEMKKE